MTGSNNPNGRAGVDVGTYNAMWTAYCEKQSIEHVVKVIRTSRRISRSTVERYVSGKGDPRRGLDPIAERWRRAQTFAQAEEEMSLARYRKQQFDLVGRTIKLLTGELALLQADVKRRVEDYQHNKGLTPPEVALSVDKLTKSIDQMVRLGERLLGGPDSVSETRGDSRFAAWTEEEMIEFAATGRAPEHDRVSLEVPDLT